ncbi:MAG: hypothetical protein ABI411_07395 [Tahibacter sp.]
MKSHFAIALAGLFCGGAACADEPTSVEVVATVSAVNGQVLLTQQTRIGPAKEGALLRAGDRLMTFDHSDALIAFVDGCQQRMEGDSLLTIGETSNCAPGRPAALSFRQAIGESGRGSDDDRKKAAGVIDASNATGTTSSTLTTGQKWTVTAALLVPIIYYWDRNRHDDDDRPPVSR